MKPPFAYLDGYDKPGSPHYAKVTTGKGTLNC